MYTYTVQGVRHKTLYKQNVNKIKLQVELKKILYLNFSRMSYA